ncbi:hypothetical protein M413DRAFT_445175 [Hebeloma cylindrosporum]|uniref:MYND-type domain-containing protein n=1 Tax=Hebeloma cylindrosporum TaxID=76867 RepID=A0A0C3BZG9_HEBCY|nr:hypothetical protein M413DRAFT_445175 [Hebeloma cylindrosporum h7]
MSSNSSPPELPVASKRPLLPRSIIVKNKKQPNFFDPCAVASMRIFLLESRSNKMLASALDIHHHWRGFGFDEASGRDVLHLAATVGDVLLTHELLYLGFDPNVSDKEGVSPLFMALYTAAQAVDPRIVAMTRPYRTYMISKNELDLPGGPKQILTRQSSIVGALIEQHADVNKTCYGVSLLELALRAKDWPSVALLLKHGADPNVMTPVRLELCTFSPDQRNIFFQFVKRMALAKGAERPPRKCPCWSGKTLNECHGVPDAKIPYPLEYICFCGTKKAHSKCCSKKPVGVLTKWNESIQRISVLTDSAVDESQAFRTALRRIQALDFPEFRDPNNPAPRQISGDNLPFSDLDPGTLERFRKEMVRLGIVDPAFAYGMTKLRFPLPANRASALKLMRKAYQSNWNAAIDEYISLGVDPRSTAEIERQAKIGTWGGSLIKECESDECTNLETDPGVEKMLQCSKCQITVYCSYECQKAHWRKHKHRCNKTQQSPQLLPSQRAIQDYLAEKIRTTPDIAIPLGLVSEDGEEVEFEFPC